MATPSRRTSSQNFLSVKQEKTITPDETVVVEIDPVEETAEATSQKMFETFSHIVETPPQIIEEIVPTADPGPRFIEALAPAPVVTTQPVKPPTMPKRHPRNIPKFSRIK
jgi:hypothetical protein